MLSYENILNNIKQYALEMPKRAPEIIQNCTYGGDIKSLNRPRNNCQVITSFTAPVKANLRLLFYHQTESNITAIHF